MECRSVAHFFHVQSQSESMISEFIMALGDIHLRVKHYDECIYSVDLTDEPVSQPQPRLAIAIERWCEAREGKLSLTASFSEFQSSVWGALLSMPRECLPTSYSELAKRIGRATSYRAVARVMSTNRFAVILPCHLVNRKSGALTGYKWGIDNKEKLLRANRRVR